MTGSTLRPGTGDLDLALLPLEMEGFHQINRSTTPSSLHSFKSELRAALLIGKKKRRGAHDADSRPAPSASTSDGHPVASELQRLLLAIHNEVKGCKAEIQGCRTEIRSCRDDINVCVGEIKKINNRVDTFEKKVESSFSAVAGTLSRHEAKVRDFHEWVARSEKEMNERFKMYDERSNSIVISAAELREQAESLENVKVQLIRFSESGPLRLKFEESRAKLRRTLAVSLTLREPSQGKEPSVGTSRRISSTSFLRPT